MFPFFVFASTYLETRSLIVPLGEIATLTHCDATTITSIHQETAEGDLTGYKKYAKSQPYKMQSAGEYSICNRLVYRLDKKRRTGDVLSLCKVRRVSGAGLDWTGDPP